MRLGSANTYDKVLQNLYTRQSNLASQQDKLTSGKSISRPSDDPLGAAQAERDLTRLTRISSDQRALGVQSGTMTLAESTLGDASSLMQNFRQLLVSAGNAILTPADRTSIAQQMGSLRAELLTLANRTDSNGIALFNGLGSTSTPFTEDALGNVIFTGNAGQSPSTDHNIPGTMNGQAIWMDVPSGNGTFNITQTPLSGSTLTVDAGSVSNPALVTGHNYSITFAVASGVTTYGIVDTTPPGSNLSSSNPYTPGQTISFDGQSFVASGTPLNGDVIATSPSTKISVFKVLDDAISSVKSTTPAMIVSQGLGLSQLDAGMNKILAARGQAGDWLNRADSITSGQQGRTLQLTADMSREQDLDMVQGLSDFQKMQTGYQVALQSYAQVQKLSLFNFIN